MARVDAEERWLPSSISCNQDALPVARDTFWKRLVRGVWRVRQKPHWGDFAGPSWLEHIMDLATTDDFHAKQGRSTGRVVLGANGRQLVVYLKRHYRLPRWAGLLALFRPGSSHSPAFAEWDHLEMARGEGLPVPQPVAAGELIGPWGRLKSFLAVEELTGMLALHEAIPAAAAQLDPAALACWKRGLTLELVRLTRELHRRRWFHNDLYLCHFFIATEDTVQAVSAWRGRVAMIDLHRLAGHTWTSLYRRAKDLGQLLYSSDLAGLTARDRVRFWREYVRGENLGWLSGCLLRWMLRSKAWVYQRNHRRKLMNS
jgi:heptose I phosphotransferase